MIINFAKLRYYLLKNTANVVSIILPFRANNLFQNFEKDISL